NNLQCRSVVSKVHGSPSVGLSQYREGIKVIVQDHNHPPLSSVLFSLCLRVSSLVFQASGTFIFHSSYSNSSNSFTNPSKYANAVATGPGCSISTPAPRNKSKGHFEHPPFKNPR